MVETVKAYMIATVKRGKEHDAAQRIRKIKEVVDVLVTTVFTMWLYVSKPTVWDTWTRLSRTHDRWRRFSRPVRLSAPNKETA
jgi:hypothetical protein